MVRDIFAGKADWQEAAELHDALSACDDLDLVVSRLTRLHLLTKDEAQEMMQHLAWIIETIQAKF